MPPPSTDTTAPTFVRAVLSSDGGTIVLTYDEVLDAVNTPGTNDFAVTVEGEAADLSSNSPVTVRGRTVSLGLDTAVTADQDVKVAYTDPADAVDDTNAIQDPAGNDAASLIDQEVRNASAVPDERAPEFLSAATTSDGLMIVLTFDEDLDSRHGPRTSDFGVTVQGERQTVSKVTVRGKTVTLELNDAITTREIVVVIYTDPTAGVDDRNAIQDTVGNDADSLTKPVANNSPVTDTQAPSLERAETTTDGGRIVLIYDEVLDAVNVPPATAVHCQGRRCGSGSLVGLFGHCARAHGGPGSGSRINCRPGHHGHLHRSHRRRGRHKARSRTRRAMTRRP